MSQDNDPGDGVQPEGNDGSPEVGPQVQEGDSTGTDATSPLTDAKPSRMVGVELADGKVVEFAPHKLELATGDLVVVDNERDLNLGKVMFIADNREDKPLRKVIRRVSPEDALLIRRNKKREEEAFEFCQRRITERKLPMKLIRVAYLHGGNKAIFFFSADGRVDFRALVRDLAQQLHVRIEMRQIGVRDESKMLGGIGICGQQLCCTRFLRKFVPVSIKMAKNQNLALNPQKLSGLCGRLMCCLVYEDKTYRELRKALPKIGSTIETPEGEGRVVEHDVLEGKTTVQLDGRRTVLLTEEARKRQRDREQAERDKAGEGLFPDAQPRQPDVLEPSSPAAARGEAGAGKPAGAVGQRGRPHAAGRAGAGGKNDQGKGTGRDGRRRRRKKSGRARGEARQKAPAPGRPPRTGPDQKDAATPQDKADDGAQAKKRRKRRSKRRARRRKQKDAGKPAGKDSGGTA